MMMAKGLYYDPTLVRYLEKTGGLPVGKSHEVARKRRRWAESKTSRPVPTEGYAPPCRRGQPSRFGGSR